MKQQRKKKRGSVILFRILFLLALIVFCYSGFRLLKEWKRYHDGEQEYDSLAREARVTAADSGDFADASDPEPSSDAAETQETNVITPATGFAAPSQPEYYIDFAYLSAINSEVVGWVTIPNTQVDYPIVQTDNNDDYLRNSFRGQIDWIGCPFVDYRNSGDFTDPVTYVYGHDLNNGAMFPDIKKYRDESFYKENAYFYIFTPDRTLIYQVFSAYTAHKTDANAFRYSFADDEAYQDYLNYLQSIAFYDTGVPVNTDSRIVALVTCESDRDYRFVLNGVLVQEIEESH